VSRFELVWLEFSLESQIHNFCEVGAVTFFVYSGKARYGSQLVSLELNFPSVPRILPVLAPDLNPGIRQGYALVYATGQIVQIPL
jgi:hypothetical protein